MPEANKCINTFVAPGNYRSPISPISPIRATIWHKLLTPPANCTITALTTVNHDSRLINHALKYNNNSNIDVDCVPLGQQRWHACGATGIVIGDTWGIHGSMMVDVLVWRDGSAELSTSSTSYPQ